MKEYLAIFQIGPVQEFIQTAKRTVDYWAGSFMLSCFCALAIREIGKDSVVFPDARDNPLFLHLEKNGAFPWIREGIHPDVYRPTLPHRILCRFQQDLTPLENARSVIQEKWKEMADIVQNNLPAHIKTPNWQTIWDRQTRQFFQTRYAWIQWENTSEASFSDAYHRILCLMGSRKSTRWFEPSPPEMGHKCTLCGLRQALFMNSDGKNRARIREEWNEKIFKSRELAYKIRQGETLCAVCLIKRLAPDFIFGNTKGVPSTSTMAVAATVKRILESIQKVPELVSQVLEFRKTVRNVANKVDEPRTSAPVPLNARPIDADNGQFNVDGDWLSPDFYNTIRRDHEKNPDTLKKIVSCQEMMTTLLRRVKTIHPDRPWLPPGKYFAVVAMDGDSMGKAMGSAKGFDGCATISRVLSHYSVKQAPYLLETRYLAYGLYFGGDDATAFIALEDVFDALNAIRHLWKTEVEDKLTQATEHPPSLSAGVIIAHHQDGLRGLMEAAQDALHAAKEVDGKDAFCIRLSRRSGSETYCRSKWRFGNVDVLPCLDHFRNAYQTGVLSPAWIEDLRQEKEALGDPPRNLDATRKKTWYPETAKIRRWEIQRLIRRHTEPGTRPDDHIRIALELHDQVSRIDLNDPTKPDPRPFEDFMTLMDTAQFVAKGGGR